MNHLCLWIYAPNCEIVWWGELLWDFPFSRWDFEFSVTLCCIKWLFGVIVLNLEELRTFCLGCYYISLFLSVLYLCRCCIYHVDFKPFSSAFYGKHHVYSYVNKPHSLWSKDIFLLFLVSWRLMISEKRWMIGSEPVGAKSGCRALSRSCVVTLPDLLSTLGFCRWLSAVSWFRDLS